MKLKQLSTVVPLLGAAVVAAGVWTTPVAAQSQNSQQKQQQAEKISDAHLAAARRAVIAAQALQSFDDILPMLAEQTKTIFVRSDPSLTSVIDDVTTDVALKLADRRPDLDHVVYEVWARRLSEDELNKIADFYESPVGQKLADLGPELTALSVGAARQWQDRMSTEMVAMVRQELEARGLGNTSPAQTPSAAGAISGKGAATPGAVPPAKK